WSSARRVGGTAIGAASRSGAGSASTQARRRCRQPPFARAWARRRYRSDLRRPPRRDGSPARAVLAQADARFEVQCGQRFAAAGIVVAHHTHSFVTGAAGAAGLGSRWFTWRTSRKTANATMMKLINVLKN